MEVGRLLQPLFLARNRMEWLQQWSKDLVCFMYIEQADKKRCNEWSCRNGWWIYRFCCSTYSSESGNNSNLKILRDGNNWVQCFLSKWADASRTGCSNLPASKAGMAFCVFQEMIWAWNHYRRLSCFSSTCFIILIFQVAIVIAVHSQIDFHQSVFTPNSTIERNYSIETSEKRSFSSWM